MPDKPPSSEIFPSFFTGLDSKFSLWVVVFVRIKPSTICDLITISQISVNSLLVRSGDNFIKVAFFLVFQDCLKVSLTVLLCKSRKPGVFGEEIFIVT